MVTISGFHDVHWRLLKRRLEFTTEKWSVENVVQQIPNGAGRLINFYERHSYSV
jgi:hypothetical protein